MTAQRCSPSDGLTGSVYVLFLLQVPHFSQELTIVSNNTKTTRALIPFQNLLEIQEDTHCLDKNYEKDDVISFFLKALVKLLSLSSSFAFEGITSKKQVVFPKVLQEDACAIGSVTEFKIFTALKHQWLVATLDKCYRRTGFYSSWWSGSVWASSELMGSSLVLG